MIQSPALSPLSLTPALGDVAQANVAEGAELADFGALLAHSSGQAVSAATAAVPLQTPLQPSLPAVTGPAMPGKNLPPELPLGDLAMEPEHPLAKSKCDTPDPGCLPVVPLPLTKTGVPVMPLPAKGKAKDLPEPCCDPKDPPPPAPLLLEAVPVSPQLAVQQSAVTLSAPPLPVRQPVASEEAAVLPAQVRPEQAPPTRRDAAPQPAATALVHAAPQAAFLRAVQPRQNGIEQPAAPASPAPLPAPTNQVRIELAPIQPVPPVMRALVKEDLRPAPVLTAPEVQSAPAVGGAPHAAPVPLQQAMPAAVMAERPQDFSALIDRLVAAREAAAPQTIAVTVPHADFGQVHLRFRRDEAGLAVALASADPAFARAASAMPPVLPVSDPQAAQGQAAQSASRHDSAATANQSGGGQQRQSQAERRDDQPQAQHQPRSARGDKPQHRSGIFA